MNSKLKFLTDRIYLKLKKNKYKKIDLEKSDFHKFVLFLINNG